MDPPCGVFNPCKLELILVKIYVTELGVSVAGEVDSVLGLIVDDVPKMGYVESDGLLIFAVGGVDKQVVGAPFADVSAVELHIEVALGVDGASAESIKVSLRGVGKAGAVYGFLEVAVEVVDLEEVLAGACNVDEVVGWVVFSDE